MVRKEWWTDETKTTNNQGVVEMRAFKGTHLISVICPTSVKTKEVSLDRDTTFVFDCSS